MPEEQPSDPNSQPKPKEQNQRPMLNTGESANNYKKPEETDYPGHIIFATFRFIIRFTSRHTRIIKRSKKDVN